MNNEETLAIAKSIKSKALTAARKELGTEGGKFPVDITVRIKGR